MILLRRGHRRRGSSTAADVLRLRAPEDAYPRTGHA